MTDALMNCLYLRACRGEPTTRTPIWLNRQAGRYMPEYHQLKGDTPSLKFFTTPELAAQATIDAQRILSVDAAIMFADLLPMLMPMGLQLDYPPGGPRFANPLRSRRDIEKLRPLIAEEGTGYIAETVRYCRSGLPADIPLIGFAGMPFTLASYAIEGQGSRNYLHVKKLMHSDAEAWTLLMNKLVDATVDYLALQVRSGVQAVQLFDSWAGCLSAEDFIRHVQPFSQALIHRLRQAAGASVPIIYFATGNPSLSQALYDCGPDLIALDWRSSLVETWDALGSAAIQGNLDPALLCVDAATLQTRARALLDQVGGRAGHVFNLGHGILPQTPVDNVKRLVDLVQSYSPGH